MGKLRSRWESESQKPAIMNLSLPRLSPTSAPQCHTPHRGACSNLVSRSPPALPPGHPEEMAPEASAAFFSLHNNEPVCQSVAGAEPLLLPRPHLLHSEGSATQGAPQRKRAAEAQRGGHSVEKPRGQDRDPGILRRTQSIPRSRASSRRPHTAPAPVSSPAGGCGEPPPREPLGRCPFHPSGPFPGRELSAAPDPRAAPQCHIPSSQLPLLSVQAWPDPGS